MTEPYELYYWPILPRSRRVRATRSRRGGRALPRHGAAARSPEGGGLESLMVLIRGERAGQPAYAPPVLVQGDFVLAQTAAICAFLGERHGLAPDDSGRRMQALQLQLTVADVADEAHNTHHPVERGSLLRRPKGRGSRSRTALPRRATHAIPAVLSRASSNAMEASGCLAMPYPYADLSLFPVVGGVGIRLSERLSREPFESTPNLIEFRDRIARPPAHRGPIFRPTGALPSTSTACSDTIPSSTSTADRPLSILFQEFEVPESFQHATRRTDAPRNRSSPPTRVRPISAAQVFL